MTTSLAALARVAEEHGLEVTPLDQVDPGAAARVPLDFQSDNRLLIFGSEGEGRSARLLVALDDPRRQEIVDELRFQMQVSMRVFLAPTAAMESAWAQLRQGSGPLLRAAAAAAVATSVDAEEEEEILEPEFLEEEEPGLLHDPGDPGTVFPAASLQAGQAFAVEPPQGLPAESSGALALPAEWNAATPIPGGQLRAPGGTSSSGGALPAEWNAATPIPGGQLRNAGGTESTTELALPAEWNSETPIPGGQLRSPGGTESPAALALPAEWNAETPIPGGQLAARDGAESSTALALPSEWNAETPIPEGQRSASGGVSFAEAVAGSSERRGEARADEVSEPPTSVVTAEAIANPVIAPVELAVPALPAAWGTDDAEPDPALSPMRSSELRPSESTVPQAPMRGSERGPPAGWAVPVAPLDPSTDAPPTPESLSQPPDAERVLDARGMLDASVAPSLAPQGGSLVSELAPEVFGTAVPGACASEPAGTEIPGAIEIDPAFDEPPAPTQSLEHEPGDEVDSRAVGALTTGEAAVQDGVHGAGVLVDPERTGGSELPESASSPTSGTVDTNWASELLPDGPPLPPGSHPGTDTVDTDWARELLPDGPPPPPDDLPGTPVPPGALVSGRALAPNPSASQAGRLGLTDADLEALDGIERLAAGGDEALEAEKVRPARMVASLIRLLMRKGVIDELEFLEELSRK